MIAVIGPNPAIDRILDVPGFMPGASWQSRASLHIAGGKPMNVARTLRRLDVEVLLVCPLGGKRGEPRLIAEACQQLGVELSALPIAGTTRTCVIVVDSESAATSAINEPGPRLSVGEAAAYEDLALESVSVADLVLGSGSLPPGVPRDFYGHVARCARERDIKFILDATGEALRRALEERPWAVKINAEEIAAATGATDPEQAAANLMGQGVEHVVVTQGAGGALYFGPDVRLHVSATPVAAVNPIGSGDAFLAGLAAGLYRAYSWTESLSLASAVAGLAASRFSPDVGPKPDLEELLAHVEVTRRAPPQ